MTAWGREGETAAYRNMVRQFAGPEKVVAFVVDSYDVWNALDHLIGETLHDEIIASGGRIVIRPDSGDPIAIVPRVIEHLMRRFGHTMNSKGYRVLPPYLRMLQGDGINLASLPRILEALKLRAISADNLAFGMGGGLLQQVNRDTMKWAMKASWAEVEGVGRDIFKDPVTDPGKRSRGGRHAVVQEHGQWLAIREDALAGRCNELRTVFRDGRLQVDESFAKIRQRVAAYVG
jgi:nicotinamide phosphoribosyltransferase